MPGWGEQYLVPITASQRWAVEGSQNPRKSPNSETKSRKIVPKAPKRLQRWGLQTVHRRKSRSHIKKRIFGPKYCIFGPKICFFLRYAHITHFFGPWQTWLNGIISSPCPEVTLDTFGFLVGARWAARRAVFWPRLPKMALFWAKNAIFSMLRLYNPYFWPQTEYFQILVATFHIPQQQWVAHISLTYPLSITIFCR